MTAPTALGPGVWAHLGAGRHTRLAGPGNPPVVSQAPTVPSSLAALVSRTEGGASWRLPVVSLTPVTGWRVVLVRTTGGASDVLAIALLPAAARSWSSGVLPDGKYEVRVQAINAAGAGDVGVAPFGLSADETETPVEQNLPPSGVRELAVVQSAAGTVRYDFLPPATDPARVEPTGYRVIVLDAGGAQVTRFEPVTALSGFVMSLPDATYRVVVAPLSARGDGPAVTSAPVTVSGSPLSPPIPVSALTAVLAGTSVSYSYTAPAPSGTRAAVTEYFRELLRGGVAVASSTATTTSGTFVFPSDGTYSVRVTPRSTVGPGASATSNSVVYTASVETPVDPDVPPVPTSPPSPRPASYPEFRLDPSGDNRAAAQAFLNAQAESSGRAARLVGTTGAYAGFLTIPARLTYFRNSVEDLVISGEQQGHLRRHGVVTSTASPISGGFTRGSTAITVQSTDGFSAGDKVYVSADDEFDHKPYKIGMRRRVTRIVGNVLELDLPLHRTGTINRRVRKVLPAGPIEFLWDGGPIRHSGWKGSQTLVSSDTGLPVAVSDDGDNFVQQMFTVAFVLCDDVFAGQPGNPIRLDRCGAGVKTAAGVGGEYHLSIDRIPDLTRDASSIAHWGYGLSEDGNRQTTYFLRSRWTRHAMTTQHNTWVSQWDVDGISGLDGYGETEYCRFVYDVADTMSTGVNTHGGGYNNSHEGVIRDTGRWGNRAELKRDPTGLFFRSRRDHVGPAGLVLDNIATRTSTAWYAAITTAEKSSVAPSVFSLADGPVYSRMTLGRHNTKAGLRLKQPSTIGPDVTINMQGPNPGIFVEPSAAGSRVVGTVTVIGGSKAVEGAQYLSGAENVRWVR